jgi:hypothetical protein
MNKKQDIETDLLALFDAHERICQARAEALRQYPDDQKARGAVIESFDKASDKLAETAVDRVQHHVEEIESRAEREQR